MSSAGTPPRLDRARARGGARGRARDRLSATNPPYGCYSLCFVTYAAVGGLIAARHPRNPVGWLFCRDRRSPSRSGDLLDLRRAIRRGSARPRSRSSIVATAPSNFLLVALALMLFPTGHYLSPGLAPRRHTAVIAANARWVVRAGAGAGPARRQPEDRQITRSASMPPRGTLHALADAGGARSFACVTVLDHRRHPPWRASAPRAGSSASSSKWVCAGCGRIACS